LSPLKKTERLSFPVNTIEVLDVRQDTSKFGYFRSAAIGRPTRQFCFEQNASIAIASFFNKSYKRDSLQTDGTLLYCLKKCWLANADTIDPNLRNPNQTRSRLYLKAELFFEKDSLCYPLYRFDSVFTYLKPLNTASAGWVEEALTASLGKLNGLSPEKVTRRNHLPRNGMSSYYADEQQTAISHLAIPAKGVYLTIEQFKNNRPAHTDYEISFDKTADIMRVKEADGNYAIITKDWGFCDGEQCFIRLGPNYFRLFKTGNTYEVYGTPRLELSTRYYTPIVYGPSVGTGGTLLSMALAEALKSDNTKLAKLRPFQLDMETGKVY